MFMPFWVNVKFRKDNLRVVNQGIIISAPFLEDSGLVGLGRSSPKYGSRKDSIIPDLNQPPWIKTKPQSGVPCVVVTVTEGCHKRQKIPAGFYN